MRRATTTAANERKTTFTAIVGPRSDGGSAKFGVTPGGGRPAGILDGSIGKELPRGCDKDGTDIPASKIREQRYLRRQDNRILRYSVSLKAKSIVCQGSLACGFQSVAASFQPFGWIVYALTPNKT